MKTALTKCSNYKRTHFRNCKYDLIIIYFCKATSTIVFKSLTGSSQKFCHNLSDFDDLDNLSILRYTCTMNDDNICNARRVSKIVIYDTKIVIFYIALQ